MVDDHLVWNALLVTTEYVVINIGTQTVLALLLAVLMHRLTTSMVVRGIIMLPYLVSNVVVAVVWYSMLDPQIGIVNALLHALGFGDISFFGSTTLAMVFPAMKAGEQVAQQAFASQNVDVQPFLVQVRDKTTHLAPIADHWSDISAAMTEAMESYLLFKSDISVLDKANNNVNAMFK